ncbi:hypothetical protein CA831_06745, partial [Burkholderia multivorans]
TSRSTCCRRSSDEASRGALDGLKVVDLSRVLGGPYCTQALADHGATVIKIEPPGGDETRGWGPPFAGDTAWYFLGVNRNKEGLALDLSRDEGRAILWRLLEDADVLVENFKPGTLARWGMDYARDLQPRFPRLIHCAVTGFGADGPLGGLPGYDAVIQAMAGLMSVNGERDGDATRIGLPIVDMVTGLNALAGILLALAEREKSGRGQSVDIALYDCGVSLLHPHLPNFFGSARVPERSGNAHPNIAPYDSYRTATVPIFLAVGNDRQFARLVAHLVDSCGGAVDAATFRDATGLGRKRAIQILEFFDRVGYTRFHRDLHFLRTDSGWAGSHA